MTFDATAKATLNQLIMMLFPAQAAPERFIIEHIWRDRRYVGEYDDKVAVWRGWSANLHHIDPAYRTVFIDAVPNRLAPSQREKLFGASFANAIAELDHFVVAFVLDFPKDAHDTILAEGFMPRVMSRVLHACIVVDAEKFLTQSTRHWATETARLVHLQQRLSNRADNPPRKTSNR